MSVSEQETSTSVVQKHRPTDFLPSRFQGDVIDADLAEAHYLGFEDYLEVHKLPSQTTPEAVAEEFNEICRIFKRTLKGQARLWIENKNFSTIADLRKQFLARFSPGLLPTLNHRHFTALSYTPGDTAQAHLAKISKAAAQLSYGEDQIRDKFISTLPLQCRSAVLMSASPQATIADLVMKVQCYFDLQIQSQPTASSELFMAMHDKASSVQTPTISASSEIHELCTKIQELEPSLISHVGQNRKTIQKI
ncbi:hypothetical protein BSL78_22273 [Apostichopus japonicus]|uniref:Retrotransposon gag domain-containing protein n=1 Tax=Stichopus japonicus TaxID=307972 RepID=A0A2G8JYS8_STIJA|nr:hypothetical protein BSL78_22273 [Apostichopus japonicus]